MGLLDALQSDEGRFGMGLLAAAAPRVGGGSFGQRLQEAVAGMDANKRQQLAAKLQAMQMQQAEAEIADKQAQRAQGQTNQAGIMGQIKQGGGFDPRAFLEANPKVDLAGLQQAMQMNSALNPAPKFETVASGSSMYKIGPSGPELVMTAPKEESKPEALKIVEAAFGKGSPEYVSALRNLAVKTTTHQPGTSVSVSMAGPKAFEQELGKLDAKQLDTWRSGAEAAQNSLGVVNNLRAAEAKGAYSGGLADTKLAAANLINGLTGATPTGLVGSELYNAEASKLVLEHIKTLGANPSNADREFIQKTVPQLSTSALARKQMVDFIEQKANRTISLYKRAESHARKNSGLSGFEAFDGGDSGAKVVDFGSLR